MPSDNLPEATPDTDKSDAYKQRKKERDTRNRKRDFERKLYVTDEDTERFFKAVTNRNLFDKSDEYPAMTAAQLEGREHTDQVRKARLTQGEDVVPNSPYADDDGTWSPMRTVVSWMAETLVNRFIEAMGLSRLQDTVLRLRLMGLSNQGISDYIEWKTGKPLTKQQVYRILNSLRPHLLEFLTDPQYDDVRDMAVLYVGEVNRDIAKPKSTFLHPSRCDCHTFEHLRVATKKKEKMYVPLAETDASGKPFMHPVEYERESVHFECAHCRKRRTQEQYDKLMAGQEFD